MKRTKIFFVFSWSDILSNIREFCEKLLGHQRPIPVPETSPAGKRNRKRN